MKSFIRLAYALVFAQAPERFGHSCIDDLMRSFLNLIISLAFFVGTTGSAAVITFRGENTNAASWRTPSVPKAINPAGNNIYGNDGYVMFNTTPANSTLGVTTFSGVNPFTFNTTSGGFTLQTLNVMPKYVSAFTPESSFNNVSTVGTGATGTYLNMDNPAGGTLKSGTGYAPGSMTTFTNLFTFTVNSSVPSNFVVGLFLNNNGGSIGQAQITGAGGPRLAPEPRSEILTRSFSPLAARQTATYTLCRPWKLQME